MHSEVLFLSNILGFLQEDEIELAKQNLQMQVLAQAEGLKKKLALLESLHLPGSEMSTISQPTDDLRNTMKQLQQVWWTV